MKDGMQNVTEHTAYLSKCIENYVAHASKDGVVIGLSGGVDSSLVATLACKGLGAEKVMGLAMPCGGVQGDVDDACRLARWLGIEHRVTDLCDVATLVFNLVSFAIRSDLNDVTRGNIKSRLRMVVLYACANQTNRLVIGTTNRSEMEVGYFTKGGDGFVDFEPIAEYWKGEIYEMARELEIGTVVPNVLVKPPSAGLWDGQKDEDELPPYEQLDAYLKSRLDPDAAFACAGEFDLDGVENLILSTEHKRQVPDICPRLVDASLVQLSYRHSLKVES